MMKRLAVGVPMLWVISSLIGCSSDTQSMPGANGAAGASGESPGAAGATGGSTSTGTAGVSVAGRGSAGSAPVAGAPNVAGKSGGAGAGAGGAGAAGSGGAVSVAGSGAAPGAAGAAGAAGTADTAAGAGGGGGAAAGSGGAAAGSGGSVAGSGAVVPAGGTLNETIVVAAGQTFDGGGKRFTAGPALGDGSQDEDQKPLFKLEDGATLANVVIGSPGADGIHCHGDVTLRNITWEDIGEDAMTIKEAGTVTLDGGSARNGDDKVFQINAESTFKVSNFKASNAGKFIRQNGGTKFKVSVVIDKCDISNMDESIFRTDSSVSTVEMTNTRYSKIGDELFMGVSAGNIKTSNNTEY